MADNVGRTVMVQGRIVWCSGKTPFVGKVKTDMNTKQPLLNAQGQPKMEYGFGLAVPKASLQLAGPGQPGEIWAAIHAEAMTMYPNGAIPPSFAMKFKDGDGIDDKGMPFAQREGYTGHLVFACTTSLPPKFFKYENGANIMVSEGIKCGDYVNVQLQIKAHPAIGQGKAGLYLNPNAVQFLGFGKEIINTPSGDQIFGVAQPAIPQGASAMPIAPVGMLVPSAPPMAPAMPAMPGAYPPPMQQPVYQQPVPPPQAAPMPHYGVLPQVHQPPPGGAPMQQPVYQQPAPYAPPMAPAMPAMPGAYPPPGYPQQ